MNPTHRMRLAALAVPLVMLLAPARQASTPGAYTIEWYVVAGGTAHSTGDGYALDGMTGQPEAGAETGGGYTLASGFWSGAGQGSVYLPFVMK